MIITYIFWVLRYNYNMKKYIIPSAIVLFIAAIVIYIAIAGANISPV